jgi:hypothetical protein
MSVFKGGCEYFCMVTGPYLKEIQAKCLAKYPRGANLVAVDHKRVGDTWEYGNVVDMGRIFLTYERIKENVNGLDDEILAAIKKTIEEYDPAKEIVWLFLETGHGGGEVQIYVSSVPQTKKENQDQKST